jgi:hypothetical protein
MFLKNEAFRFGYQTSTSSDDIDELRAQIEQLRFNLERWSREVTIARVELVIVEVLTNSPPPATSNAFHSAALPGG